MEHFLKRLSSRKFLAALAVQVAAVVALFWPAQESDIVTASIKIAALVTLLLAGLGYGKIEASIDGNPAVARPVESKPPKK